MLRHWKRVVAIAAALIIAGGAYVYWSYQGRLVQVGDVQIDPNASIDPSRSYTLVVWEREVPLPWETGAHTEAVNEAISEFQKVWPNIHVELRIFGWEDGHGDLREALSDGNPPDVYGMPLGTRLIDAHWQIPVTPYMSAEAAQDTLESALRAVSADGVAWGWPRWILPQVWIAREDLTESLGGSRVAWNADEFLEILAESKTKSGSQGIMLNPYDGNLFFEVMVASTGRNVLDETGRRAWSVEEMTQALTLFDTIIDRGLTLNDAARMSRTRLATFWNRQASIVAPVNAWLLRHLMTRGGVVGDEGGLSDEVQHTSVAVPPPTVGTTQHYPALVGGYAVFRKEPYQGDDHTKAAMLLAEHLSRRLGPWEAANLFAVPAHFTSWEMWRTDSGLPEKEIELLTQWSSKAIAPPLADGHASRQQRIIDHVLGEAFVKLWSGVEPLQIAEEIAQAIDGVRAEVAHP